jgi:thiol-disulfide isomerase/thioredoxin
VLEVYSEWCGPCKAINATCKRLYFDHGDRGLKFYTTRSGLLDFTRQYKGKCEPVFMFFKDKLELKDLRLEGVNCPKLTSTIMEQLEMADAT